MAKRTPALPKPDPDRQPFSFTIDPTLVEQIAQSCKKPEDVIGQGSFLQQLTTAVLNRMLQAEIQDHLGHEKNHRVVNQAHNSRSGLAPRGAV
jgi:transposase-like protein